MYDVILLVSVLLGPLAIRVEWKVSVMSLLMQSTVAGYSASYQWLILDY
jgi:hypothetical protein